MACTFDLAIFVAELREDVVSKQGKGNSPSIVGGMCLPVIQQKGRNPTNYGDLADPQQRTKNLSLLNELPQGKLSTTLNSK